MSTNISALIDNVRQRAEIYYGDKVIGHCDFKKNIMKIKVALTLEEWLFIAGLSAELREKLK